MYAPLRIIGVVLPDLRYKAGHVILLRCPKSIEFIENATKMFQLLLFTLSFHGFLEIMNYSFSLFIHAAKSHFFEILYSEHKKIAVFPQSLVVIFRSFAVYSQFF